MKKRQRREKKRDTGKITIPRKGEMEGKKGGWKEIESKEVTKVRERDCLKGRQKMVRKKPRRKDKDDSE